MERVIGLNMVVSSVSCHATGARGINLLPCTEPSNQDWPGSLNRVWCNG